MASKPEGTWSRLLLLSWKGGLKTKLAGMWAAMRAAGRELRRQKSLTATSSSNGQQRKARDRDELPDSYGHPRVTLMVVDPYLIYAYWDVDVATLPPGTKSAVLRFHAEAERGFEEDVDLRARNWYVHVRTPAQSYYAELGVKTAAGEFIPVAASNEVRTPRAWPVTGSLGEAGPLRNEDVRNGGPLQDSAEVAALAPAVPSAPGSMQNAVFLAAAPSPPPVPSAPKQAPAPLHVAYAPRRVDAVQVLEQKLAEIYALRPWRSPAAAPFEVTMPAAAQSSGATTAQLSSAEPASPAPAPLQQPRDRLDPTEIAEHAFSPGLPSSSYDRSHSWGQP